MPTPGGLLKKHDKIQHKNGRRFEVVERRGNDKNYSVVLKPIDDFVGRPTNNSAYGYPRDHILVTEMHFWLTVQHVYQIVE